MASDDQLAEGDLRLVGDPLHPLGNPHDVEHPPEPRGGVVVNLRLLSSILLVLAGAALALTLAALVSWMAFGFVLAGFLIVMGISLGWGE